MELEVDVEKKMQDTPRPHYLCGIAKYIKENNQHKFFTRVNFTSKNHPSILDRTDKYVSKPHVNVGDICFALWNAAHIIAELNGYGSRILREEIIIKPIRLIPPDTELDLEILVNEEKEVKMKGKPYSLGTIYGSFYLNKMELIRITAKYSAEKQ